MKLKLLMVGVFAVCIFVQYNDPDPYLWMVIYAVGLVLTIASIRNWLPHTVYSMAGVVTIGAAVYVLTQVENLNLGEVFSSLAMASSSVEEFREAGGLVIQGVWLSWLGFSRG